MGLSIHLYPEYFLKRSQTIKLNPAFDKNIFIISMFPGCDYQPYLHFLESHISGIIIKGFGSGNLPQLSTDWISFVDKAVRQGKSIFISSQSPHGNVDLTLYECGRKAMDAGAISLGDMTSETAVVKLMLLAANIEGKFGIEKKMIESFAGEISS
jgi:L-asparaginase